MSSLLRRASAILSMVAALGVPASAQQPPLRDLPKPSKEIDDPFTLVTGVAEIRDGKVVVVDGGEGAVSVVDFASATKTALGRRGQGPGEYQMPAGIFRLIGDTLWLFDAPGQRMVAFLPDLKPGTTFPFLIFDQQTSTALSAPFVGDRRGRIYANAMVLKGDMGRSGGTFQLPDTVVLVRVDPRADKPTRTELARMRFPTSGKPEMKVEGGGTSGTNMKFSMAYPGLVAADAWAVFPDGRIAIVRSAYTVEYIAPDGKRTGPVKVAYDRFKVTDADKKAELDEARSQMQEQMKAARRMMPPNMNFTMELTPPASWPAEYPAVSALGALAASDGLLWVRRAIPTRLGREQWDVIDQTGKLVARWQLPPKVNLVAVGSGVVYTVRKDEDDLRYVQQVVVK